MFVLGNDPYWMDVLAALGFDPHKTQDVSIDLPVDGAATVTATILVEAEDLPADLVTKRFMLMEIADGETDPPRYLRPDPESTFGLICEHASGNYSRAYPNDFLTDPKRREMIHRGLDRLLDDLAAKEPTD